MVPSTVMNMVHLRINVEIHFKIKTCKTMIQQEALTLRTQALVSRPKPQHKIRTEDSRSVGCYWRNVDRIRMSVERTTGQ